MKRIDLSGLRTLVMLLVWQLVLQNTKKKEYTLKSVNLYLMDFSQLMENHKIQVFLLIQEILSEYF